MQCNVVPPIEPWHTTVVASKDSRTDELYHIIYMKIYGCRVSALVLLGERITRVDELNVIFLASHNLLDGSVFIT